MIAIDDFFWRLWNLLPVLEYKHVECQKINFIAHAKYNYG